MIATPARGPRLPLIALGYSALAVLFTWPLVLGLDRDVPGDLGDSLLNMWILDWVAQHAPGLLTGRLSWQTFWNGNIFYPEPLSLALSEHMLAQAMQIAPVYALTGNIILSYNLLFLSTFILSAFGTYLLVRDLTGDWKAAFIAGLAYGFLPYRVAQIPHVQVLSSQWMPLALWGFNRFVERRSTAALAAGTAALVLQNWSCGYYLLFFAPFVPIFIVHRMWSSGRLRDRRAWSLLAASAIVTVGLTIPFLLPYLEVQRLFGFDRGRGEVLSFSANLWAYATAVDANRLWGRVFTLYPHQEGEAFPGVAAPLLALVAAGSAMASAARGSSGAATAGWRRVVAIISALAFAVLLGALVATLFTGGFRFDIAGIRVTASAPGKVALRAGLALMVLLAVSRPARNLARTLAASPVILFAGLMLMAAWLSLGPEPASGPHRLQGMGLYGLLYDYVPGFNGLRVPARYAMIVGLFLSVLCGYGAAVVARRKWGAALLAGLAVFVFADGAAVPLVLNRTWGSSQAVPPARVYPASRLPPIYRRIRDLPPGTVLAEFPFGDDAWEMRAVFYAAAHHQPILNGYSGAFPPAYLRRSAALRRVAEDGERAWDALIGAGATHALVHVPAFARPDDARLVIGWLESHGARYVASVPEGDALYSLPR